MKPKRKSKLKTKVSFDKQSIFILSLFGIVILAALFYHLKNSIPPTVWVSTDEQLPNNEVCMVNDVYLGVAQIEVPINNKRYYGCCEMCIDKLNNNTDSIRFGTDPYTGEKVDKAKAFIVLQDKSTGLVYYFKSKLNYEKFKKENNHHN